MRFFEIFFLFSPSWQLQRFHSKQIIAAVTRERSKVYAKFNNFHKQELVTLEQEPTYGQVSRNDEIKEIFDVPAQLLCREFYQKHYGQGLTVNQTCENDVTLLNCSFVEETRTYLNPIEESDPDQIASVFKKGFQNASTGHKLCRIT